MDDVLKEVDQASSINNCGWQLPQRLKASLWFSIGKIVDEESLRLKMNATPQFIGALTEMVWEQIGIITLLSRFSIPQLTHHSKRCNGPRILLPPCRQNYCHDGWCPSCYEAKWCSTWYCEGLCWQGEGEKCEGSGQRKGKDEEMTVFVFGRYPALRV